MMRAFCTLAADPFHLQFQQQHLGWVLNFRFGSDSFYWKGLGLLNPKMYFLLKSAQKLTLDRASKFRSKNEFFDIFVLLSFLRKILLLALRFIFVVALLDSFLKKVLLSPSPKMAIFDRNFKARAQFQFSFAFDKMYHFRLRLSELNLNLGPTLSNNQRERKGFFSQGQKVQ